MRHDASPMADTNKEVHHASLMQPLASYAPLSRKQGGRNEPAGNRQATTKRETLRKEFARRASVQEA